MNYLLMNQNVVVSQSKNARLEENRPYENQANKLRKSSTQMLRFAIARSRLSVVPLMFESKVRDLVDRLYTKTLKYPQSLDLWLHR